MADDSTCAGVVGLRMSLTLPVEMHKKAKLGTETFVVWHET
jgi:hypothetical protein